MSGLTDLDFFNNNIIDKLTALDNRVGVLEDGGIDLASGPVDLGEPTGHRVTTSPAGIVLGTGNIEKIVLENDGDVFVGSDLAAPGTTYFSIFSVAQTYNGESMGAGDMLIGDNSVNNANILWDKSAGQLLFRGGTSSSIKIDTDGTLVAGSSVVTLNNNGITLAVGTAYDEGKAVTWKSGTTRVADVYGLFSSGVFHGISIATNPSATSKGTGSFLAEGSASGFLTLRAGTTGTAEEIHLEYDPLGGGEDQVRIPRNLMVEGWVEIANAGSPATKQSSISNGDMWIAGGLVIDTTAPSYNPAANALYVADNIYINETVNTDMARGVTINQGAFDNHIISLKSSDVAHGVTGIAETDTFGYMHKRSAANGGLQMVGVSSSTIGMLLAGVATSIGTGKSTTAVSALHLEAYIKSGTGIASPGANANLVGIRDGGTTRAIFDGDGQLHLDSTVVTDSWDEHDDMALVQALRAHMVAPGDPLKTRFAGILKANRRILEETGVVTINDGPGEDGSTFLNISRAIMLSYDALRQMHDRLLRYEKALLEMGADPALLEA